MALIKPFFSMIVVGAFLGSITFVASSLIYATTLTELAPTEPIASFPTNTFLENVVVNDNGDIYITSRANPSHTNLN